jgi:hypothetical protein
VAGRKPDAGRKANGAIMAKLYGGERRGSALVSLGQDEALAARQFDDPNSAGDVEAARREQRL